MYKRSCVKKFDQGGTPMCGFIDFSTNTGGQEDKHRAHLFALSFDDVIGDVVEELDLTFHEVPKLMFELGHFGLNRDLYLF
jgi:hypothetical protein